MIRSILIVVLVTLAKLHFGDGVGPVNRYGSFPSRFSTAPAPAPAPSPSQAPLRSPSIQRTPSRNRRFDNPNFPQQSPSPGLTQSRSFDGNTPRTLSEQAVTSNWRPQFGTIPVPQQRPSRPQPIPIVDSSPTFPPGFFQNLGPGAGGGRADLRWGPQVPDLPPGAYMVEVDEDGNPLSPLPPGYRLDPNANGPADYEEYIKNQKRQEEEADPDSHKINTEGELIEQQLPTGGGNIVIKISGTNITQRKMNKLREFLKKSIDFVFTNTQFKTPIRARFM